MIVCWPASSRVVKVATPPVRVARVAGPSSALKMTVPVGVPMSGGIAATVAAKLINGTPRIKYPASNDIVRYDFIRENGRWAIDDVRSTIDAKEWSLKGLLNIGLKQ